MKTSSASATTRSGTRTTPAAKVSLIVAAIARWAVEIRNGHDGRDGQDGPTYEEIAANAAHALIGVACSLLDRQIARLAKNFENDGGFTERLYRTRTTRRRQGPSRP